MKAVESSLIFNGQIYAAEVHENFNNLNEVFSYGIVKDSVPVWILQNKKTSHSIFLLWLSLLPVSSWSCKKRGLGYEDVSNYNKPVRWHHRRSLATFSRHPYIPYWLPREAENICSCWVCCHPRLPSVEQQLLRTDFWGIVKYSYQTTEITKHIQQEQFVCISYIDHKASIILWGNVKSLKKIFKKSSKNAVRHQPTFLEKRKIKQNGLKSWLTRKQHNVELYLLQRPEKKKGNPDQRKLPDFITL